MNEESILIVDDEARMRKLIKDFLKVKGYHILEAEDGEKALEIFETEGNKINLIFIYFNWILNKGDRHEK